LKTELRSRSRCSGNILPELESGQKNFGSGFYPVVRAGAGAAQKWTGSVTLVEGPELHILMKPRCGFGSKP
jgi:hypothetical protein